MSIKHAPPTKRALWILVTPPRGWVGYCHLPVSMANLMASNEAGFVGEDVGQFRFGGIVLDVGWTGRVDDPSKGEFKCLVVRQVNEDASDWGSPLEVFKTRDPVEVYRWLCAKLETDWWPKEVPKDSVKEKKRG